MTIKKVIQSAEFVKYNANNRGNDVGDCVKRSMSLAFDVPYYQIGKLLNAKMKEKRKHAWNIEPVFSAVIMDLGGHSYTKMSSPITVDDFAENEADPGTTYLLLVGKKFGQTSHLVCVRDQKIWDSWDCRDWFVTGYYVIPIESKPITDVKDHLEELVESYFTSDFEDDVTRQMFKWGLDEGDLLFKPTIKGYSIYTSCKLEMSPTDVIPKKRAYTFQIVLPIEPTMTVEEAEAFIRKTAKVRIYDRLYSIAGQEKKLREEWEVRNQMGYDEPKEYWLDARERKFIATLPGWARALIKWIDIQDPNQYHDSYRITMRKLPTDDRHPNITKFSLEAYTADQLREMIDRYGKYGEIEGIDYYQDW